MQKNLKTLIGLVLAVALAATACGGGSSADDQAVIDAFAAQLNAEGDVPPGVDVGCFATSMVDALGGAEKMEADYGLTAETIEAGAEPGDVELSVDVARSFASDSLDCGLGSFIVSEMVGEDMSSAEAECIFDKMDKDAVRDLLAADFMSSEDGDRIGEAAEEKVFASVFSAAGDC